MLGHLDQSIAKLKDFEGCVPWMYRDTAGKVTVGVGLMLPNAAAACAQPFVTAEGLPSQNLASPEQIAEDFARVAALPPGKLPEFYKSAASPELPQPAIEANLTTVLTEFEATLRARIPSYDQLPDPVKVALLDMAYNLGPTGLLNGYPRLLEAVETGAWAQAATECTRGGIGHSRNAWTQQQFLSAVMATIRAVASMESEIEAGLVDAKPEGWFARLRRLLRRRK